MWWWMPVVWIPMWFVPDAGAKDSPTAHAIEAVLKLGAMIAVISLATFVGDYLLKRKVRKMSGDEDERAVVVGYRAKDTPLGSDVGMLCAEDGWLHFRGERTEWSLRVPDVRRRDLDVHLLDHDRTVTLRPLENDLEAVFDDWESARPPAGPSTLPPLVAAPEVAERIPKAYYAVIPVSAFVFLIWATFWLAMPGLGLYFCAISAVLGAILFLVERRHQHSLAAIGALALPETGGKGVP